jgi:hypothetical protein
MFSPFVTVSQDDLRAMSLWTRQIRTGLQALLGRERLALAP